MWLFAILLAAACPKQGYALAGADTLQYAIYFSDREAGFQKTWQDTEGAYHTLYEFNDRGRGPGLYEKITLSDEGLIESLSVSGHDYLKDSVSETFTVSGNRAAWESTFEEGSAEWSPGLMYTPGSGSFLPSQIMAAYLINNEGREADLLPAGQARLLDAEEHVFGDTLSLKLVSIAGISFTPYYLWLDDQDRLFSYMYTTWFSILPKGYEALKPELLALQTARKDAYFKKLAADLIEKPSTAVAITNVALYNPEAGQVQEGMTVMFEDDRITMVQPTASAALPDDIQIIDGSGKTLLPGLFDMHTHISQSDGLLHLAAGITSVRDLGNTLDLPALKKQFDESQLVGPRMVVMAGFIDQKGPYAGPIGKTITSLDEGLEAVEYYHKHGYKQIKLYSSIDPAWVAPIAEKVHALGMRLSGHIPAFMTAEQAVRDGYDEIQHANMVLLNFMPDTIDTRTTLRFTHVAEHGHEVSVESESFGKFIDLLKAHSVVLDPTVSVFENMLKAEKGEVSPVYATIAERLPAQAQRGLYSGGLPVPEGKRSVYNTSYGRMLDIVRKAHESGITIVPGTDAMAGFALHRELENYVSAGISEEDVLKMATLTSAEVSGVSEDLGSVAEGKLADMILVNGRPTDNISDIRNVVLTIKNGDLYYPEDLYRSIGVSWTE